MNRYLALIIAALTSAEMQAFQLAPRLVVNITVNELRSDYIEAFTPLFNANGFKKLMHEGEVFDAAGYPFTPIDESSAIATIATGTTPYYHGIVSTQWLDRSTLQLVDCVSDRKYGSSPARIKTSTIGDEMKMSSRGRSIVYSIATSKESAILSAGHSANNAVWFDSELKLWQTSSYYGKSPKWLNITSSFDKKHPKPTNNDIAGMAQTIITSASMGADNITDMLSITLSAANPSGRPVTNWQTEMEGVYLQLDNTIGNLIEGIERKIGKGQVLFVITSTGTSAEEDADYSKYNIPTGTFYINRTASLLNVYLSAIYGQGQYVETSHGNQIFLNHKLIEQKRLSLHEVLNRCQELLIQNAGVGDVYTSERLLSGNNDIQLILQGFNPALSGDILIDVAPGWKLYNENTQEKYTSRAAIVPFPIIIYGAGTTAKRISTPVTVDRIAPTIAKSIRIRAPNACKVSTL